MPTGPTIQALLKARDWFGVWTEAEGRLRAADSFTVLTSRQNLVVRMTCCETGIFFSSGVRICPQGWVG